MLPLSSTTTLDAMLAESVLAASSKTTSSSRPCLASSTRTSTDRTPNRIRDAVRRARAERVRGAKASRAAAQDLSSLPSNWTDRTRTLKTGRAARAPQALPSAEPKPGRSDLGSGRRRTGEGVVRACALSALASGPSSARRRACRQPNHHARQCGCWLRR